MKKSDFMRRLFPGALALVVAVGQAMPFAVASAISIPSASSVMGDIENRYHISSSTMQDLGETLNVATSKKYSPEVSIFFSPTDPREGQKITAKALPMYFSTPTEQMYYTWYLKRKDDSDDVNGWKVTAMRMLANDGADPDAFIPGPDDGDGFRAEHGGGSEFGTNHDWCYVRDSSSGEFYELGASMQTDFSCGTDGYEQACIASASQSVSGDFSSTYSYEKVGDPTCNNQDRASCPDGSLPRCVNPAVVGGSFELTDTVKRRVYPDSVDPVTGESVPNYVYDPAVEDNLSCESKRDSSVGCFHLFPDATGYETGDGSFPEGEERFWMTNPADPDTANNGNKDEANIAGLGRDTFTWNYQEGDRIGVVVEGNSMLSTKHDDSSMMIMWAFSGKGCPVRGTGSYTQSIKGYSVNIPTANMSRADFDKCLKDNLVDPLSGGQENAKKLEVSVMATPERPMNDPTGEAAGDTVVVTATISNSDRTDAEVSYEWKVEAADNVNMASSRNITDPLRTAGLLTSSKGNGLSALPVTLNMDDGILGDLSESNPVYLRFSVTAKENFGGVVARSGRSDVIVQASNSDKKIIAYGSGAAETSDGMRVSLGSPICNAFHANPTTASEAMDNLDRVACRVSKNEIIGLHVDTSGFSDFHWTLDGKSMACDGSVSSDCSDGSTAFFAVVGAPGSTINVGFEAVSVETGKAVSLSRTFVVVEPEVLLEPIDDASLWPRYVGQHVDLDGNAFDEFSENYFERFPGDGLAMKARFIPTFSGNISTRTWMVDGVEVPETTDMTMEYLFSDGTDALGSVHDISLSATIVQPLEKRKALRDIWGIGESQSTETVIGKAVQVTTVPAEADADSGTTKFYAALSGYVPSAVSFAVRAILSGGLLLFTVGFLFSLIPETSPVSERRR